MLSLVPSTFPITPFMAWLPLLVILAFSAIKDAIVDIQRWKRDKQVNNMLYKVLAGGKFEFSKSENITVGDIVIVEKEQSLPADSLLLMSSSPNGLAYIDTVNLDGEMNLKTFKCVEETRYMTLDSFKTFTAKIRAGINLLNLYHFEGSLILDKDTILPVDQKNLLLAGCYLKNTDYICVAVVYVGLGVKIYLNTNKSPSKFSATDKTINKIVLLLLVCMVFVCLGFSISNGLFENYHANPSDYLADKSYTPFFRAFLTFWSYLAIFSYFIPVSLSFSLELCKMFQSMFMTWDLKTASMMGRPMTVNNSNLNDELPRVEYLFCDKTGTLTQNVMSFDRASISGVSYDSLSSNALLNLMLKKKKSKSKAELAKVKVILNFLLVLALTSTVIPTMEEAKDEDGEKDGEDERIAENQDGKSRAMIDKERCNASSTHPSEKPKFKLIYQGTSPDEVCLCNFASENGVILKERNGTKVTLEVLGKEIVYDVLQVFEFTSERARMSVIVRGPDGSIMLYCKGADHVMMPRMISDERYADILDQTQCHVDEYADDVLRTLVIGKRELSIDDYVKISIALKKTNKLMVGREEAVAKIANKVECQLEIVGCTGIEDQLQEGVVESIKYYIESGIKVWMVTGDKQNTAINISKSCNLIQKEMKLVTVNARSVKECSDLLDEALSTVKLFPSVALVIDGSSLLYALACGSRLLDITKDCVVVIICRASPTQKALVVRMIKRGTKAYTLSIGDGANDISMIQEAHVGVGIYGKEGSQAALAGDYAIHMFRDLLHLICVQGRYSLLRSSSLILISYYKNFAIFFVQIWFSLYNGFSSVSIYDEWILGVFNVLLTSLPPLALSVWDRDLPPELIQRYPKVHSEFRLGQFTFNYLNFVFWTMIALWHSLVIFFIPVILNLEMINTFPNGKTTGITEFGMIIFVSGFTVISLRMLLAANSWNLTIILSLIVSGIFFLLCLILVSYTWFFPLMTYKLGSMFNRNITFIWILATTIALAPDLVFTYIKRNYWPDYRHQLLWSIYSAKELQNTTAI